MKPFGQFFFSFSLIFSPLNSPISVDSSPPLSPLFNDDSLPTLAYILKQAGLDDDIIADNWSPEIDSIHAQSEAISTHAANTTHPQAVFNTTSANPVNALMNPGILNLNNPNPSPHSSRGSDSQSGFNPEGPASLGTPFNQEPEKKERRAYLATYPRSGNHWTRYLIEEATHIATGSVYCDFNPQHMRTPFEWGGYCCEHGYEGHCRYAEEDETVLIKTHIPALDCREFDENPYFIAIRIIRHPVDSFYSYYKFIEMLHQRANLPNKLELTTDLIQYFIRTWREFQEYWDQQPNVLTVRYEYMLEHPEEALKIMLRNLCYEDREEDIKRAVIMHPPEGSELKHLSHFSQEDLKLINEELSDYLRKYDYKIPMEYDDLNFEQISNDL